MTGVRRGFGRRVLVSTVRGRGDRGSGCGSRFCLAGSSVSRLPAHPEQLHHDRSRQHAIRVAVAGPTHHVNPQRAAFGPLPGTIAETDRPPPAQRSQTKSAASSASVSQRALASTTAGRPACGQPPIHSPSPRPGRPTPRPPARTTGGWSGASRRRSPPCGPRPSRPRPTAWSRSAACRSTGAFRPLPSGPASPAPRRTRAAAGWPPNSSAALRGASTTAVQLAGGWRNPQMVARYASAIAIEHGAVAQHFGGGGG